MSDIRLARGRVRVVFTVECSRCTRPNTFRGICGERVAIVTFTLRSLCRRWWWTSREKRSGWVALAEAIGPGGGAAPFAGTYDDTLAREYRSVMSVSSCTRQYYRYVCPCTSGTRRTLHSTRCCHELVRARRRKAREGRGRGSG